MCPSALFAKDSPNTGLDQILMSITIFEVKDVDVMTMSCRPRSDLQDIFSTMFSRRLHGGLDWWAWEDRGDPAEEVSEAQLWGGTKIQLGLSLSDFNFQILHSWSSFTFLMWDQAWEYRSSIFLKAEVSNLFTVSKSLEYWIFNIKYRRYFLKRKIVIFMYFFARKVVF